MQCPYCQMEDMRKVHDKKKDMHLNVCRECDGAWIFKDEFRKGIAPLYNNLWLPATSSLSDVKCPICKGTMKSTSFPYLEPPVGLCEKCGGLWVFGHDLKDFVHAVEEINKYGLPDHFKRREGALARLWHRIFG